MKRVRNALMKELETSTNREATIRAFENDYNYEYQVARRGRITLMSIHGGVTFVTGIYALSSNDYIPFIFGQAICIPAYADYYAEAKNNKIAMDKVIQEFQ